MLPVRLLDNSFPGIRDVNGGRPGRETGVWTGPTCQSRMMKMSERVEEKSTVQGRDTLVPVGEAVSTQAATDRQPTTAVKTASAADPRSAEDGKASGRSLEGKRRRRRREGKLGPWEILPKIQKEGNIQQGSHKENILPDFQHDSSIERSRDGDSDEDVPSGKFWSRREKSKGQQADTNDEDVGLIMNNTPSVTESTGAQVGSNSGLDTEEVDTESFLRKLSSSGKRAPGNRGTKENSKMKEKEKGQDTSLDITLEGTENEGIKTILGKLYEQARQIERLVVASYKPKAEIKNAALELSRLAEEAESRSDEINVTQFPEMDTLMELKEEQLQKLKKENREQTERILALELQLKEEKEQQEELKDKADSKINELKIEVSDLKRKLSEKAKKQDGIPKINEEDRERARKATEEYINQKLNMKKTRKDLLDIIELEWSPGNFNVTKLGEAQDENIPVIYLLDHKWKTKEETEVIKRLKEQPLIRKVLEEK
ncbi:hypothetical protein ABEB36_004756 [Hypothenemus hampei]|uniref:Uncharacterized protein n=1 Tax=Hypothenemus hampei TaxID=57062 RepID=A0ABD1EVQ7_HYPHA